MQNAGIPENRPINETITYVRGGYLLSNEWQDDLTESRRSPLIPAPYYERAQVTITEKEGGKFVIRGLIYEEAELDNQTQMANFFGLVGMLACEFRVVNLVIDMPFSNSPMRSHLLSFGKEQMKIHKLTVVCREGFFHEEMFKLIDDNLFSPNLHISIIKGQIDPSRLMLIKGRSSLEISSDCACCTSPMQPDLIHDLLQFQRLLILRNMGESINAEALEKYRVRVARHGLSLRITVSHNDNRHFFESIGIVNGVETRPEVEMEEVIFNGERMTRVWFKEAQIDERQLIPTRSPAVLMNNHRRDPIELEMRQYRRKSIEDVSDEILVRRILPLLNVKERLPLRRVSKRFQELLKKCELLAGSVLQYEQTKERAIRVVQKNVQISIAGFASRFGDLLIEEDSKWRAFLRVAEKLFHEATVDVVELEVNFAASNGDLSIYPLLELIKRKLKFSKLIIRVTTDSYDPRLFDFVKTSPASRFHLFLGFNVRVNREEWLRLRPLKSLRVVSLPKQGPGSGKFRRSMTVVVDNDLLETLCHSHLRVSLVGLNSKQVTVAKLKELVAQPCSFHMDLNKETILNFLRSHCIERTGSKNIGYWLTTYAPPDAVQIRNVNNTGLSSIIIGGKLHVECNLGHHRDYSLTMNRNPEVIVEKKRGKSTSD